MCGCVPGIARVHHDFLQYNGKIYNIDLIDLRSSQNLFQNVR